MSKDDDTITGGPAMVNLPGTYAYAAPDQPVELPWAPPPGTPAPAPDFADLSKFVDQLQPVKPQRSSVLLALRALQRELRAAEEAGDVKAATELLKAAIADIENTWGRT